MRTCPACGDADWAGGDFGPKLMLVAPDSPRDHPELKHGMDGVVVYPSVCGRCGFTALFSVERMDDRDPWAP